MEQLAAAGVGLAMAMLAWLLWKDDDRPRRPCYWPCKPGDCGQWIFGSNDHQRVLVTRRLPVWMHRSDPN